MFGKLLKHDFLAIFKNWRIVALASIVGALIGGLSMRLMESASEINPLIELITGLGVTASFFLIFVSAIGAQLLIYIRYYKHFFSDEGYLTFTLPAKRSQLLASKTVNAVIWSVISILLLLVEVVIFTLAYAGLGRISAFISELSLIFQYPIFPSYVWYAVYAAILAFLTLASSWFQINIIYFCITMGATLAKKHKILAAFGIYYATNMVLSFASQFLMVFAIVFINESSSFFERLSENAIWTMVAVLLFVASVIIAAIGAVFYAINLKRIKNNLNLA